MKCLVLTLGALVLPLVVVATRVQQPEDDLFFEAAGTPVPVTDTDAFQERKEPREPKEKKKPAPSNIPINLTVAVGQLLYHHVADHAVRFKPNKKLPWLFWNSTTSTLMGVPSKKDVGEYNVTFESYLKHEHRKLLNIRVIPKILPNKTNKKFRCKEDDDKWVLIIVLKAKFDNLKPQVKANAIYRLHRIYNLNLNTISIESNCDNSQTNAQRKKRLTSPNNGDHKCALSSIHVQIGCNRREWKDPAILKFQKSIAADINDKTLTEILEIPALYRITKSVTNLYSRNRREAGSGYSANSNDNERQFEGSADSGNYDEDYDEEDEEDEYNENDNEDIVPQVSGSTGSRMTQDPENEHPHRHHHGEGTNISEGPDIMRGKMFRPELPFAKQEQPTTTSELPETTLAITEAPTMLTWAASISTNAHASSTSEPSEPIDPSKPIAPSEPSEPSTSETSPMTGSPETPSSDSATPATTLPISTVQVDRSNTAPPGNSSPETTDEPESTVTSSSYPSRTVVMHETSTESAHTPVAPSFTSMTFDAPSTIASESDSPELPQMRTTSFVFSVTTEEPTERSSISTMRGGSSGITTTADLLESSTLITTQLHSSAGSSSSPTAGLFIPTTNLSIASSTNTTISPTMKTTVPTTIMTETSTIATSPSTPLTTTLSTTPSTTTEKITFTYPPIITTEKIEDIKNFPPIQKRMLPKLAIVAGKPYSYMIPGDAFSDPEDGDTKNLKLDLMFKNGDHIRRNHYLQFNKFTQKVYGLPLESDVSEWNYELFAYDSEGLSVSAPLVVRVQQHKLSRTVNHEFSIHLKVLNIHGFRSNVDWKLKIIQGLDDLYEDYNTDFITVRSINITEDSNEVVFTWTNDTIPRGNECPVEDIEHLKNKLHVKGKYPHPSQLLKKILAEDFEVIRVTYQGIGQCEERPKPHTPKFSAPEINLPPTPRNQVDHLNVTAGMLLVYRVPEDTFFDKEDGSARQMKMNLYFDNRSSIPDYSWLQFDSKNQEFYGVPLREDVGRQTYHLVVTDKDGATARDSLVVVVNMVPYTNPTVEFSMILDTPYEFFVNSALKKRNFIERIQELYQDRDTSNIILHSVSSGSTIVTWRNRSLPTSYCPHEQIERLRRVLVQKDKSVTDRVHRVMGKEFTVMQVTVMPLGVCLGELTGIHSPDSFVPSIDDSTSIGAAREDYLVTFVLPGIIIAAMLSLAGVIACILYKRRRSGKMSVSDQDDERQSFKSKGIPVIFQDELDEKPDPGNKSPVILKEEKPPLPPPEYQKTDDGAHVPMLPKENSEEPYQPPPPFTSNRENNRQSRPRPTMEYRKPPPYVPP